MPVSDSEDKNGKSGIEIVGNQKVEDVDEVLHEFNAMYRVNGNAKFRQLWDGWRLTTWLQVFV